MLIAGLVGRTCWRHFDRFDIDPAATPVKPYDTVYQSKNGVIATQSNIPARQKLRSALPDNDISGHHLFTAKLLYAEPFADAVPPVLNAALTFFMRHTSDSQSNKRVIDQSLQS